MTRVTVLGVAGGLFSTEARKRLAEARLVVGGARHLDAVELPDGVETVTMGNVGSAVERIRTHPGPVVVLASGDPGFFGIVGTLRRAGLVVEVLPEVSSVAQAFARIGEPWQDARVVSAHGRQLRRVVNVCRAYRKVAVLTGPGSGPAELGAALRGLHRRLVVALRLGTAGERVVEATPEQAAARSWSEPNVTLVLATAEPDPRYGVAADLLPDRDEEPGHGAEPPWIAGPEPGPAGWALPEAEFAHRDSMITKYEVRALALARLAPKPGDLVWDVGAGSGSVAVECARFGAAVVAVERDAAGCDRIAANAARHGAELTVIHGEAPAALTDLPEPDAVFVGGGGPEVLAACLDRTPDRIVAGYASLERGSAARRAIVDTGYRVDGVLLQSSRLTDLPDGASRLAATNPVLLLWGTRARDGEAG